jgi:beta-lactamase superfamily II metal-dependent hydrolase
LQLDGRQRNQGPDTDAATWKDIQRYYKDGDFSSSLLLGSHHGSLTFFDDPSDKQYYYTAHIKAMAPAMTILSVGDNGHGHPDSKAIKLYEKHSSGSDTGKKLFRTDVHGTMRLELKDGGRWTLKNNQ